ncbi:MAG: hypothetical protein K8E66_02625, partial [Phycisphaerales bacterium]|nr:hypothetical protein [Phycisphaerales bacterium]
MTRRTLIVVIAAGGIAGIAHADGINHTETSPAGPKAPTGYVYANGLTGERVISDQSASPVAARGAGWAWSSQHLDPCDTGTAQVFAIHDSTLGIDGIASPDDLGAWQGWMEHPGDSIVNLISFGLFTSVLDPEEDGVPGHEMILVMTENDRATQRSGAVASAVLAFTELPGADDEN